MFPSDFGHDGREDGRSAVNSIRGLIEYASAGLNVWPPSGGGSKCERTYG